MYSTGFTTLHHIHSISCLGCVPSICSTNI